MPSIVNAPQSIRPRLDSHQHFWSYNREHYSWIQESWPIRRVFLPPDLEPLLRDAGLDGCIAVQARQTREESAWLLELARRHPSIRGVVGWVDLQSDRVEEDLAFFSENPRFVGVRHVVQDEPDDAFMLRPAFLRGLGYLKQFKLRYDFLVFPKQLKTTIEVARRFPEQPFVLDHIAKPSISEGTLSPWREQTRELARCPNVWCKVSGMVTEAKWGQWKHDDFRPYLDVVADSFGEDRLMFGSDWPVCLLSATYAKTVELVASYFSASQREKIFGENAARFYLDR